MALATSEIYRLSATKLREQCSEQGLNSQGPVRFLRERLVRHWKGKMPTGKQEASDEDDVAVAEVSDRPHDLESVSHVVASDSPVSVLTELLRQVPVLTSEYPEAILELVSKLDEFHDLGLVDDRVFVVRVLPKVSGAVLRFFGECLRSRDDWENCKTKLLREFFPLFVRERLIRDLIVFNFHGEGQALRVYIDKVFFAAKFLKYEAGEEQLVNRILMNLHPSVLAHAAFLDRPHTKRQLLDAIAMVEEKLFVLKERSRTQPQMKESGGGEPRNVEPTPKVPVRPRSPRCWNCGSLGHFKRECRRKSFPSGNGRPPGGRSSPGREH